jgi:succinoglycan biosynthesis protein ExoO
MSAPTPEISVVMAVRNGGQTIAAAIQSLLNQTIQSWELIVVDDGSDDDSVAVAERVARGDTRISIIAQPFSSGPGAARNRGMVSARGSWVAVFDSDDMMLPRRLEMLLKRTHEDDAEVVADNLIVFSSETGKQRPFLPAKFAASARWISLAEFIDSSRLYARIPDLGYLKPMVSTQLLRETRVRYDENLRIGEDYDFLARILARGPRRFRLEPSAHYMYRRHAASVSHRIRGVQISALIEAHERFCAEAPGLDAQEAEALERRRRSLQSMLLYDYVIAAAKAGRYGHATGAAIRTPQIWSLLTRPVGARLRSLAWHRRNASPARASV